MASFTAPASISSTRDISQHATRLIIVVGLSVAAVIFVITPFLAIDWSQRSSIPGVLLGPNFIVSDASGANWGPNQQVAISDRIVQIGDKVITDLAAYQEAMHAAAGQPDRLAHLTLDRSQSRNATACGPEVQPGVYRCEAVRAAQTLSISDMLLLFGLPYAIGAVYVLVGFWVFRQRGLQRTAHALAAFCIVTGIALATYFDGISTTVFTWMSFVSFGLMSGALFSLALLFPQPPRLIARIPLLRFASYAPGLVTALLTWQTLKDSTNPWAYFSVQAWLFILILLSVVFFLGMLIYRQFRSDSPVVQQQSRIAWWGGVIAFLPIVLWIVQGIFNPSAPFIGLLYLPSLIVFPLAIAYAMLRYHQLNFERIQIVGLSYLIVGSVIMLIYLAAVALLSLTTRSSQTLLNNPLLVGLFVLLVVVAFDLPRRRLSRALERALLKERFDTQSLLQNYSRQLTEAADLTSIVHSIREQVKTAFNPERLYLYLLDARLNAFAVQAHPDMPRLPSEAAQFALESPLPRWLRSEPGPRYLPGGRRSLPDALIPEQARLEETGAVLYVPLIGHNQLNGWLALGVKENGRPYSADDINLLAALASQSALALERAVVFDDLQRRVNELNALSRVSQAANFTLDPDDILELIYTQTSRVLDTRNFYIALADFKRNTMRFAFYIEDNERLYPDDEWPLDAGLTGEIMRRGQPIITEDYEQECLKRNLPAGGKSGRAWMGVPLNAGNQSIGIMVVSDFRPEVTYSPEQLQIFAAIADQAASVLDKGRLYRETAARARQLATLNEVGSSLTSTLDLRTVLTTIVSKAMELLNAEAGSLLLVDEQHNELVFEVTLGPAAPDLRGTRLPFGAGIVGVVAQTRLPQIVNEAQHDSRWLRDVDKSTTFVTQALLAVPMVVKDKVTGVLELLNKRGTDNFTEDDQNLLTAFATNAAVAVENARLFTLTDQALASRLEELSTLQEIDRQLNTSLDIKRVLELTLDWGLRVTDARSGSVGMVDREQNVVVIMATRNYVYQPATMPIDKGLAGHVVRTGQPILVNDVTQDARYIEATPQTKSQLSVPIKRENEVIGVVNLESPKLDGFGILQLDTATRLADHAASAITNAKLYEEVKRANDAKSEFVSVVSHELKTPMTSMKGYTDLLVKGMAGPLNDMQTQFLSTVRANVDRMSTLVNDLLEVSRIETGRLKMEIKPLEMDLIIDETLRTTQAQIEERQQTLELNIPPHLPMVLGDKARIIQVLTNLISNAYKYTPNGGHITISVTRMREIQPRGAHPTRQSTGGKPETLNPTGYLACAVKDSGVGVAPEDMAKLFTKFFRSGDPLVREQPGTGLGLSITRSLVEMQQGAIWVESEVGVGSTFTFSIPVVSNHEEAATE